MIKLRQELGHFLRDYRLKRGLTQSELAEKLGYTTSQFVSTFERGAAKIPLLVLGELIVYLNIPEKKVIDLMAKIYLLEIQAEITKGKKIAMGSSGKSRDYLSV